jgi:hypothetical protein
MYGCPLPRAHILQAIHQNCHADPHGNGFSGNATIAPLSHYIEIRQQQKSNHFALTHVRPRWYIKVPISTTAECWCRQVRGYGELGWAGSSDRWAATLY